MAGANQTVLRTPRSRCALQLREIVHPESPELFDRKSVNDSINIVPKYLSSGWLTCVKCTFNCRLLIVWYNIISHLIVTSDYKNVNFLDNAPCQHSLWNLTTCWLPHTALFIHRFESRTFSAVWARTHDLQFKMPNPVSESSWVWSRDHCNLW